MSVDTPSTWFTLLQSVGIIASFGLSAWALRKADKSNKVSNYLSLIQSHRDIWTKTLEDRRFDRVRKKDSSLWTAPITLEERQFLTFIILHITCTFQMLKNGSVVNIEGLQDDLSDLMTMPFFRRHWEETKYLHNQDFRKFVDNCGPDIKVFKKDMRVAKNFTVLVVTAFPDKIIAPLSKFNDRLIFWNDEDNAPSKEYVFDHGIDFVVCFGTSHIIPTDVVNITTSINLHGSLLPKYRGPNPNLWNWIHGGDHGVSIQKLDAGIDTGPIYSQRLVDFPSTVTFQQTFDILIDALVEEFNTVWPDIRSGKLTPSPQSGTPSYFSFKDQKPLASLLENGLNRDMKSLAADARKILKKNS